MKPNFLYITLVLLLTFCSDHEELYNRPYPIVKTAEVTSITSEGAQFHGEISNRNGNKIIDHGFIWAIHSNPNDGANEKKSLGALEGDRFSASIPTTLKEGVTYYVRSYVKTQKHAVYGNAVSFVSLGSKAPTITDYQPRSGRIRDTVSITGTGFSYIKDNNLIAFTNVKANLISHTDTLLKVIVPDQLQALKTKILVSVAGNVTSHPDDFTLLGGEISSVSKSILKPCDTLIISGNNFSTNPNIIRVQLNTATCRILSLRSDEIKIIVPILLTNTETITLKITSSNIQEVYDGTLTYKKPLFIELEARANTTFNDVLKIKAKNLPRCETMTLRIGNITPELVTYNDSIISFKIPESLSQIQNTVTVSFSNTTLSYSRVFSLSAPTITDVSPQLGTFNDDVIILGSNFHPQAARNTIVLAGSTHTVLTAEPTKLTTKISPNSSCGTCPQTSVTVGQQTVTFQTGTRLRGPAVSSISPTTFNAPGVLTINGNNFSPEYTRNQLSVGSPVSSTAQRITANINLNMISNGDPYLTSTSSTNVQVTTAGQTSPNTRIITFNYKGSWTRKTNFPGTTRLEPITFVLDNKLYMGLGQAQNGQFLNDFWEYDPSTNAWSEKNNFPGSARRAAISFVANGRGYVGLGVGSVPNLNDLWSYDPTLDTWTPLNDFPGGSKNNAASFTISDVAYITGGASTEVWKYNSTLDTWEQLSNAPVMFQQSNFVLNDKAYLTRRNAISNSFDLYEYTPASDQWILKVTNTSYSTPVAISGGYVYSNSGVFQKYNTTTNTFETLQMRATANRLSGNSCEILNKQYIFGGRPSSGTYHFDVWEFDYSLYPD